MTAFKDLETLNIEICRATGAGKGNETTPEASAAYYVELARRAVEVRSAIDHAWQEHDCRTSSADARFYIIGIESALNRAMLAAAPEPDYSADGATLRVGGIWM
jgi:hypothetical protein